MTTNVIETILCCYICNAINIFEHENIHEREVKGPKTQNRTCNKPMSLLRVLDSVDQQYSANTQNVLVTKYTWTKPTAREGILCTQFSCNINLMFLFCQLILFENIFQ